jgi:transcription elongation factor GreA
MNRLDLLQKKLDNLNIQLQSIAKDLQIEYKSSHNETNAVLQSLLDKRDMIKSQIEYHIHKIYEEINSDKNHQYYGKTYRITNDGISRKITIVTDDEADPTDGKVSINSPIAQAIISMREDNIAEVHTPVGKQIYYIS